MSCALPCTEGLHGVWVQPRVAARQPAHAGIATAPDPGRATACCTQRCAAAMLRRLEVEEWDKERMKHFYYGAPPASPVPLH